MLFSFTILTIMFGLFMVFSFAWLLTELEDKYSKSVKRSVVLFVFTVVLFTACLITAGLISDKTI